MEKSFPFNAVVTDGVPDRVYAAEDFAAERAAYVSNGVTSADALQVSPSESGGLGIDIAAGIAVIDGYTYWNTDPLTLTPSAADGALARIDLAVLRLDLTAREMKCALKTGVPSTDPVCATAQWDESVREMPLASIAVAAGQTTLAAADITDLRARADYILNPVEVDAVLSEYKAALEEYFGETDADSLTAAASIVRQDAGEDTVLCGDGVYRAAVRNARRRVELVRYTTAGEHTFSTEQYPSADNLYDILLQGGGGAGSSQRKGSAVGGDAGECFVAVNVPLRAGKTYSLTVGAGGASAAAGTYQSGNAGGASSMVGFSAAGGAGGNVASATNVGFGCGTTAAGGESLFADGGTSYAIVVSSSGRETNASGNPGSMGSGGGAGGTSSSCVTGAGGDGVIIIYGYVAATEEG